MIEPTKASDCIWFNRTSSSVFKITTLASKSIICYHTDVNSDYGKKNVWVCIRVKKKMSLVYKMVTHSRQETDDLYLTLTLFIFTLSARQNALSKTNGDYCGMGSRASLALHYTVITLHKFKFSSSKWWKSIYHYNIKVYTNWHYHCKK